MSTYGELTNQILDDLDRSDMTSQAQDAITAAIGYYRVRPWYFLEARATAQTVVNQEFFPLPDDYESHLILSISINGYTYLLQERTMDWIEARANSNMTSNPSDFAIWDEQIRLYPIPSSVLTMTMSYRRQLPELQSASSSNAWTVEAGELIRRRAACDVAETILRDYNLADRLRMREMDELSNITRQNVLKLSTGKTRRYS